MKKIIVTLLLVFPFSVSAQFVDKLISDMGSNEAILMNAPDTDWAQHGYLDMGYSPRGDATPSYWANAQGSQFTDAEEWSAILPWFHIWPVSGNSSNARVQVSDIRVQMLIDGQWQLINLPDGQWAQLEPWDLIGDKDSVDQRNEGSGAYSYFLNNTGPVHGGLGKFDMYSLGIEPWKIRGVAISAKAQIIEGSGNFLFEIGGDYYPSVSVGVDDYVLGWGPAIGGSKFTVINGETCVYMTTIDPPGAGDTSEFVQNGGKIALTHSELANNPPVDYCGVTTDPDLDPGTDPVDGDAFLKADMINILQNLIDSLNQSIADLSQ